MENSEEILQCLDEFSKYRPKDIPRELEDYLCFVAKTGDPVYQWPHIKCLFRAKLVNVITEFYESCPSVEIPPCPNVENFNYDAMKNFILEKLDTFAAAPFTVQRICELLTTPRKEYNRIDKYMRALEKNILVVSTREPGNRKTTENGESVVNGLEGEHMPEEMMNSDVNVWHDLSDYISDTKSNETTACSSSAESVITSRPISYIGYTPNISDLIIEQSSISNNTSSTSPVESSETIPETQTMTVFTLNSETTTTTTEQVQGSKEENYVKTLEQVDSVYVKADCSDSVYVAQEQIEEKSMIVQIETPEKSQSETINPIETETEVVATSEEQAAEVTSHLCPQQREISSIIITQDEIKIRYDPEPSQIQIEPESSSSLTSSSPPDVITSQQEITTEVQPMETSSSSDQLEPEPSQQFPLTSSTTSPTETFLETIPLQEVTESNNDQISSSSDEITVPNSTEDQEQQPQSSELSDLNTTNKEVEVPIESDEQQVTESNIESDFIVSQTEELIADKQEQETSSTTQIVIGPDDMQVEDISPEPEPIENSPADVQEHENN